MDRPIDRIRAATKLQHEQLDALPYARAVMDGSLPISRYAGFLRATQTVHAALESAIEASGDASLRDVIGSTLARRADLARDLAYLGVDLRAVDAAQLHALVLAQRIRRDATHHEGPPGARLLGHAYVLDGSMLGGLVQAATLAKRSELQAGGRAFLEGAGKATGANFRAFVRRLEAALTTESHVEQTILGARAAFEGFHAILLALAPFRAEQGDAWPVTSLNLEAGTHPIPTDVREVEAAIRAGEQSYRQFAYYELRYGERGLAFTRSDSAWLATLAREDEATVLHQVAWLSHLLATRGMPRLLLEQHLDLLVRCLSESTGTGPSYAALTSAVAKLRAEREAAITEARADTLLRQFLDDLAENGGAPDDRSAGSLDHQEQHERSVSAREAAILLLAAVADEKNGIGKAVESLTSWLCAPTRSSAAFRRAAERLLRSAREARSLEDPRRENGG